MAEQQERPSATTQLLRKITLAPAGDAGRGELEMVDGIPYRVDREGDLKGVFSHLDESGLSFLKAVAGTFPHSKLTYELSRTPEGYVEAHIKIR